MADSSPLPDAVTEFRDLIAEFFRLIDQASSNWQNHYQLDESHRVEMCHEYRALADDVRQRLESTSKAIVSTIVPPVGQTGVQFVTAIRDDVEEAYDLFRYTHCYDPNVPQVYPSSEQTRTAMHHRWPELRKSLWEAWRHIGHTIALSGALQKPTGSEEKAIYLGNDCPTCGKPAPIDEHNSLRCPNCRSHEGTFCELWIDLNTEGRLSKEDAGDETLCELRHLVRENFGAFDAAALCKLRDWLVAVHGMTRGQVQFAKCARLVELLKGTSAPETIENKTIDQAPTRKVGRHPDTKVKLTPTQKRDEGWLDEWNRNEYGSIAAFAQTKRVDRTTMSKALKRAREREQKEKA